MGCSGMAKIVCEKCESSFKLEIVKDLKTCPVCGELLFDDGSEADEENEKPDFEHPDLYYFVIDSEDKYEDSELRDILCNCISCRQINRIPYNKFDYVSEEYVKLKKDLNLKCKGCGKSFTNTVVPKRPDEWQKLKTWEKDYENLPKCPICSSTKIHKISMTNKAASIFTFGVFAAGHVSKTYKCDICGSKF